MAFLKSLVAFVFYLLAPVILIIIGAGIFVLGGVFEWMFLFWAGIAVIGAGIFWGFIIYSSGDFSDGPGGW